MLFYPAATTRLYPLSSWRCLWWLEASPFFRWLPILHQRVGARRVGFGQVEFVSGIQFVWDHVGPVVAASFLLGDQILNSEAIQALPEAERLSYYATEASAVQVPFVLLAFAFFALAGVVESSRCQKSSPKTRLMRMDTFTCSETRNWCSGP